MVNSALKWLLAVGCWLSAIGKRLKIRNKKQKVNSQQLTTNSIMRITTLIMLLAILTGTLTGCWDWRETSSLAIVLGTGVDLTDDNRIRLTIQIAKPSGFIGGQQSNATQNPSASWIVWAEGDTIEDAENNLSLLVSRDIYWGHSMVLVLGEKMAFKGSRFITTFFQRTTEPRETIWLMVSKGDAMNFFQAHTDLEKTFSQNMDYLMRMRVTYPVNLKNFTDMLVSKGIQPVLPLVELKEVGIAPKIGIEEEPPIVHTTGTVSGLAVFKEDKMVGWLDRYETNGLRCLKGSHEETSITIPSPAESDKKLSLTFTRIHTKITPQYDGKNIRFDVKIKTSGKLVEQQSKENLATPEKIKEMEKEVGEEIKRGARMALNKAQNEYKVDIFGFGYAFHRKYKKEWKQLEDNWDDEFTKAQVNIDVKAKITNTGLTTQRLSIPKK